MIDDTITQILAEAKRQSFIKIYPGTAANSEGIRTWEESVGRALPDDYRKFLSRVGRCKFHGVKPDADHSFSVKLFSLDELSPFTETAFGERQMAGIPDSWYTIGDAQDGNFIVMDLATVCGREVNIIDGFAECAPDLFIISRSFDEFLTCSMTDPDTSSGGGDVRSRRRYWSKPGHYYGQANSAV